MARSVCTCARYWAEQPTTTGRMDEVSDACAINIKPPGSCTYPFVTCRMTLYRELRTNKLDIRVQQGTYTGGKAGAADALVVSTRRPAPCMLVRKIQHSGSTSRTTQGCYNSPPHTHRMPARPHENTTGRPKQSHLRSSSLHRNDNPKKEINYDMISKKRKYELRPDRLQLPHPPLLY